VILPRAADDFAAIRARMEELRRERTRIVSGRDLSAPRPYATSGCERLADRRDVAPTIRRFASRYGSKAE